MACLLTDISVLYPEHVRRLDFKLEKVKSSLYGGLVNHVVYIIRQMCYCYIVTRYHLYYVGLMSYLVMRLYDC